MDFGNGSNADNLIIANWGTYSTPYLAYYNGSTKTSYPYSSITFSKNTKETYKFELIKGSEYYTLKETTQAAMYDSIDLSYYRINGKLKISEQKLLKEELLDCIH